MAISEPRIRGLLELSWGRLGASGRGSRARWASKSRLWPILDAYMPLSSWMMFNSSWMMFNLFALFGCLVAMLCLLSEKLFNVCCHVGLSCGHVLVVLALGHA